MGSAYRRIKAFRFVHGHAERKRRLVMARQPYRHGGLRTRAHPAPVRVQRF